MVVRLHVQILLFNCLNLTVNLHLGHWYLWMIFWTLCLISISFPFSPCIPIYNNRGLVLKPKITKLTLSADASDSRLVKTHNHNSYGSCWHTLVVCHTSLSLPWLLVSLHYLPANKGFKIPQNNLRKKIITVNTNSTLIFCLWLWFFECVGFYIFAVVCRSSCNKISWTMCEVYIVSFANNLWTPNLFENSNVTPCTSILDETASHLQIFFMYTLHVQMLVFQCYVV